MTQTSHRNAIDVSNEDEVLAHYLADPLVARLLMRFRGTDRPLDLVSDLAAPLRVHPSEVRKGLRVLIRGGLVAVRKDLDEHTTYLLTRDPSQRALAERVLRRVIEQGRTR